MAILSTSNVTTLSGLQILSIPDATKTSMLYLSRLTTAQANALVAAGMVQPGGVYYNTDGNNIVFYGANNVPIPIGNGLQFSRPDNTFPTVAQIKTRQIAVFTTDANGTFVGGATRVVNDNATDAVTINAEGEIEAFSSNDRRASYYPKNDVGDPTLCLLEELDLINFGTDTLTANQSQLGGLGVADYPFIILNIDVNDDGTAGTQNILLTNDRTSIDVSSPNALVEIRSVNTQPGEAGALLITGQAANSITTMSKALPGMVAYASDVKQFFLNIENSEGEPIWNTAVTYDNTVPQSTTERSLVIWGDNSGGTIKGTNILFTGDGDLYFPGDQIIQIEQGNVNAATLNLVAAPYSANANFYTSLQSAPSSSLGGGSITFTLPSGYGNSGDVITGDGTGNLYMAPVPGNIGNNQVSGIGNITVNPISIGNGNFNYQVTLGSALNAMTSIGFSDGGAITDLASLTFTNGSNSTLVNSSSAANITFTFPNNNPNNNDVLTNVNGTVTWAPANGGITGPTTTTQDAIVIWGGTDGKSVLDSKATIDSDGNITCIGVSVGSPTNQYTTRILSSGTNTEDDIFILPEGDALDYQTIVAGGDIARGRTFWSDVVRSIPDQSGTIAIPVTQYAIPIYATTQGTVVQGTNVQIDTTVNGIKFPNSDATNFITVQAPIDLSNEDSTFIFPQKGTGNTALFLSLVNPSDNSGITAWTSITSIGANTVVDGTNTTAEHSGPIGNEQFQVNLNADLTGITSIGFTGNSGTITNLNSLVISKGASITTINASDTNGVTFTLPDRNPDANDVITYANGAVTWAPNTSGSGVSSITAGTGLTGGTIDSNNPTGTFSLETSYAPGTNITFTPDGNGTTTINASGGSGSGDVNGPANSTANAIAIYSDTTGKNIENTSVTISDIGYITTPDGITVNNGITINNEGITVSGGDVDINNGGINAIGAGLANVVIDGDNGFTIGATNINNTGIITYSDTDNIGNAVIITAYNSSSANTNVNSASINLQSANGGNGTSVNDSVGTSGGGANITLTAGNGGQDGTAPGADGGTGGGGNIILNAGNGSNVTGIVGEGGAGGGGNITLTGGNGGTDLSVDNNGGIGGKGGGASITLHAGNGGNCGTGFGSTGGDGGGGSITLYAGNGGNAIQTVEHATVGNGGGGNITLNAGADGNISGGDEDTIGGIGGGGSIYLNAANSAATGVGNGGNSDIFLTDNGFNGANVYLNSSGLGSNIISGNIPTSSAIAARANGGNIYLNPGNGAGANIFLYTNDDDSGAGGRIEIDGTGALSPNLYPVFMVKNIVNSVTNLVAFINGNGSAQFANSTFTGGVSTSTASGAYNYISGADITINNVQTPTAEDYCIVAATNVLIQSGGELHVVSSKNVKDILDSGTSMGIDAVELFNKIPFSKYQYKDKVKNGRADYYGVIAEELREVMPHSVHNNQAFIPNIMQQAEITRESNTERSFIYQLKFKPEFILDSTIKESDRIELIIARKDNSEERKIETKIEGTVKTVSKDYITVETKIAIEGDVFVYGTYGNCPSVAKENIFELGMVVLQNALKKIEVLEAEIAELKNK